MALITQTPQSYYDGNNYGNYQFTSLDNIINQFIVAYIGEDKLISRGKRSDVAFHAQRAMQELSFDTFKSCKAQEITVPATLQFPLPQDYVNYTKISWVDSAGIKHLMYPTSKTSNPLYASQNYQSQTTAQNEEGDFKLKIKGAIVVGSNSVTLDGVHTNVVTGMLFTVDSISLAVLDILEVADNTVVTLSANIPATINNGDREIEFSYGNGDLIPKTKKTAQITASTTLGSNVITASSASAAAEVEIGMYVNNGDAPGVIAPLFSTSVQTTVVDVQGTSIIISGDYQTTNAAEQINFISFELDDSETWKNYKSTTPSENNNDDYEDDTYWPNQGRRYGLDPQHAQINGSYYIDCKSGKIHFSSNVSGKTVIIDYISDSLGTDDEMQVHKFAEEAMYKHIAYAMLSTSSSPIHQQLAPRFKKERFAETRKAKLRLSNIKLEEITQILRGKSKQIKH